MDRRSFGQTLASMLALAGLPDAAAAQQKAGAMIMTMPEGPPLQVGMLVHPDFVALDLVGPHTFFAALMNVRVHLLWKDANLVVSDSGLAIKPTTTLSECPGTLDVLFVPGGLKGTTAMMHDRDIVAFLRDRGSRARYVTSVCTGSLLLGAAGLLKGYRATSHWTVRELLPIFGATPVNERVVVDRNRLTGGGVTAGIDFGLQMTAEIRGRAYAEMLQLAFEYDPKPPFAAGSPESAGPELTAHIREVRQAAVAAARTAAEAAARRSGA